MSDWFTRNAPVVEAVSALVTAMVAVAALIGVKFQIDASDRAQALQTARTAYLAQQALAVQNPKYAQPADVCALLEGSEAASYEAFVTHLLFTAEQTLAVQSGWEPTFIDELRPHAGYLCGEMQSLNGTDDLHFLMQTYEAQVCAPTVICPAN